MHRPKTYSVAAEAALPLWGSYARTAYPETAPTDPCDIHFPDWNEPEEPDDSWLENAVKQVFG